MGLRFSQRHGYTPVRVDVQKDSIDRPLQLCLWKVCWFHYVGPRRWHDHDDKDYAKQVKNEFLLLVWEYMSKSYPHLSEPPFASFLDITRKFYFSRDWYEIYDFIEFVATCERMFATAANAWCEGYEYYETAQSFKQMCNQCLEKHLSAWRFVGDCIVPITSEEEIASIEGALEVTAPFAPVRHHIETNLRHLCDRESPDYRNSIKEAISAVEGCCRIATGKSKLSDALKVLERQDAVHRALQKAFDALYGYTSDANGIRHALMDEPNLVQADAKFMLVACSAFVNYLVEKAPVPTAAY